MKFLKVLSLLILVSCFIIACGDDDISSSRTAADFVGTWSGEVTLTTHGTQSVTVVVTENSGTLTCAIDDGSSRTDTMVVQIL
jgi:hypothetical protein